MESNEAKVGMKVEAIEGRGNWKNPVDTVFGKVEKVVGPDTVILKLDGGGLLKIDVEKIRAVK